VDQIDALAQLAAHYTGADLGRRIRTALQAELAQVDDTQLGELAQTLAERLDGQREGGEASEQPPQLYFHTVLEFVERWLLPTYRRSTRGHNRTWCPHWWAHPEALSRLDSLWRAWEVLRLDPGIGISVWWRDHADHHLTILLDPDGPFKGCEDAHTNRGREQLPHEPPPDGLFDRDEHGLPAIPAAASPRGTVPALAGTGGVRITPRESNGRGW
jgi:hypothetical protein